MAAELTFASIAEAVGNYLGAVGIRLTLRPLERAALFRELNDRRLRGVFMIQSAAFGNAASRLEAFVASGGMFTYGTYPDIEGLIREQATELDRAKRETTLHRIQQLMHERAMFAPIFELASLGGYGPRVAESGLGVIPSMAASAPYEDLRLKK
jgi:peptide/nickel transport system substrate-binding protein